ncbi:MAG: hypothetical protein H7A20_01765 [Rhodanobacteraceae bacterium]|nr:hypothetical protein [Rhodanobacteraceae bacterium]
MAASATWRSPRQPARVYSVSAGDDALQTSASQASADGRAGLLFSMFDGLSGIAPGG